MPVLSADATSRASTPNAFRPAGRPSASDTLMSVKLTINDVPTTVMVEPWTVLLDLLRHSYGLTGTKKGCDHGQCGACTVLVNGTRINSCLTLAVMQDGNQITTIEGIGNEQALHPLQSAFIEEDAFQCGYCTPGQICSAVGLIAEGKARSASEVRELMSGNLCRCGAYPNIVKAIVRSLPPGEGLPAADGATPVQGVPA